MENIPDSLCGKMSPEHSRQTKVRTLGQSSKKSAKSKMKDYLFLNLKVENGLTQGKSWEMRSPFVGESLMLNTGGVPQRRKRIYLVADFAGECADKILFESESLSGNLTQSVSQRKTATTDVKNCIGATGFDGYNAKLTGNISSTIGANCGMSTGRNGIVLNDQGGNRMDITEDVTCALRAEAHHPPCVIDSAGFCTEHSAKSRSIGYEKEISPTLRAGTVPGAVMFEIIVKTHDIQGQLKKHPPFFLHMAQAETTNLS